MDNVTNYALGPSEMTGLYYYSYIYGHNDALPWFMLCMCAALIIHFAYYPSIWFK